MQMTDRYPGATAANVIAGDSAAVAPRLASGAGMSALTGFSELQLRAPINGDSKTGYGDLVGISKGKAVSSGAPVPTATRTAAAKALIENYFANGGEGGRFKRDQVLRDDADFSKKEFAAVNS